MDHRIEKLVFPFASCLGVAYSSVICARWALAVWERGYAAFALVVIPVPLMLCSILFVLKLPDPDPSATEYWKAMRLDVIKLAIIGLSTIVQDMILD